ncbi:hypothetical protein DN752_20635 [Echinicola strongylocentroti]|uniref:Bacteriocin n=1 Tax=Echinicola strongylocentroti TaxID=1795355 RepID=A0A2Z4IPY3_9BACT|nr:hypothetical protein [Echinicola strongylocentroti]AWW32353.1 hypothetical protein DN752_20635 [Echinicola strongylocentroti]
MKFQELNQSELKEVNGGLLGGLLGGEEGGTQGSLLGGLSVHFSSESKDDDGDMQKSSFGIELSDLGSFENIFRD